RLTVAGAAPDFHRLPLSALSATALVYRTAPGHTRRTAETRPTGRTAAAIARLTLRLPTAKIASRHRDIRICATSHEPRPLRRHADPARRREPATPVHPPERPRALRDGPRARDRHLAAAGVDAPRAFARGGSRARSPQRPAVVLHARRRQPAGGGEVAARRSSRVRRRDARRRPRPSRGARGRAPERDGRVRPGRA